MQRDDRGISETPLSSVDLIAYISWGCRMLDESSRGFLLASLQEWAAIPQSAPNASGKYGAFKINLLS